MLPKDELDEHVTIYFVSFVVCSSQAVERQEHTMPSATSINWASKIVVCDRLPWIFLSMRWIGLSELIVNFQLIYNQTITVNFFFIWSRTHNDERLVDSSDIVEEWLIHTHQAHNWPQNRAEKIYANFNSVDSKTMYRISGQSVDIEIKAVFLFCKGLKIFAEPLLRDGRGNGFAAQRLEAPNSHDHFHMLSPWKGPKSAHPASWHNDQ
jgi:hypothetical protein